MKNGLLVILLSFVFLQYSYADADSYEKKARDALEVIVKEQVEKLRDATNSTDSENEKNIKGYVLSLHLRGFKDISDEINRDVNNIREQIRLIIRRVAIDIEINGGNSGALTIYDAGRVSYKPKAEIPKILNKKRKDLLEANLSSSVSVRSAAMAIKLLAGINDSLITRANKAKTRQEKEKIYMTQAIYVYETADIVLELLNGLSLGGKATINKLYSDAQQGVEDRLSDIQEQVDRATKLQKKGLLSEKLLDREVSTYNLMKKANKQSLLAWKEILVTVSKQEDFLRNLKDKQELIEYKRNKAKIQIETLRDLRQVAELRDTIGSLDDLVSSVSSFDLLVLDETTVRILLGYGAD